MTKRGTALVIAALMLALTAVPALAKEVPYPDVSPDHWAYEAIVRLHHAGLIEGYPDGTFGGERTFTRYEMAMVFDRILRRYDAYMEAALRDLGIDVDAITEEFGPELGLINALAAAIADAQRTAKEAKEMAEQAAQSADSASDRSYHARLTAEQALEQAKKAGDTASMASALVDGEGGGFEDVRLAAQRAQRVAADAEAAAMRATAIAEMALAASDEQLAETVEATRLAAQRAQRLAADAEAAAMMAQAMAQRATTAAEAEEALGEVESAADRAYRARLTAEQALALGQQADDKASRALAMSEIAIRDTESVAAVADEALEKALQADRLAYLAHLSAERALDSAEAAHGRIDDLERRVATTPKITSSLSAKYEIAHTNDDEKPIDPRDTSDDADKTYNRSRLNVGVGLGAAVEPREGVRVEGGINFDATVFGHSSGDVNLSKLYAQVTTDGLLRKVYFGKLNGEDFAEGFHALVLDADRYEEAITEDNPDDDPAATPFDPPRKENLAGAFVNMQAGNLTTRVVASRTNPAYFDDDTTTWYRTIREIVYGTSLSLTLTEAMEVGFSAFQGHDLTERPATAFSVGGKATGLSYEWVAARFRGDTAVEASIETTFGSVEAGYKYRSIGDAFSADTNGDYYGYKFTNKDDGIVAGRKDSVLSLAAPIWSLNLEYELGKKSKLDETDYKNWHKIGFSDADVLGFGLSAHYYTDRWDELVVQHADDKKTTAYRVGLDRTVNLGVPLTFSFVHADIGLANYTRPTGWDAKQHQAFGVALKEHALSDTLTVDAGYFVENNPIDDDWTDHADWDVPLFGDNHDPDDYDAADPATFYEHVKERTTLHARADLELAAGLTAFGGHKRVDNNTPKGHVVVGTTDLGVKYNVDVYGTDVTLGYAWQNVTKTHPGDLVFSGSPRSTYSVDAERAAWGGTLAAGYKFVTGRGSDGASKVSARDMTAHVDYTYPVADGMDFTLGGKWTNSQNNTPAADDYYFTSVKAGFAIKF